MTPSDPPERGRDDRTPDDRGSERGPGLEDGHVPPGVTQDHHPADAGDGFSVGPDDPDAAIDPADRLAGEVRVDDPEVERGRGGVWRQRWRRVERWFSEDPAELDPSPEARELRSAAFLSLAMTLVIVLTGSPSRMPAMTPLIALIGLVVPGMARNRWFWLALFSLFIVSPIARPWVQLDNHNWLQVYWLAAIVLSRFAVKPDATLRVSARFLIGFAFLFAVTWKLLAPEFITGAFFDFTFGTDRRLGDVAVTFGLQESGLTGSNQRLITAWRAPGTTPVAEAIELSPIIVAITPWLAWGTVLLEGAVAVTYLAPLPERWRWLRDATILLFVATTYPLAPVTGFGLLVLTMAVMVSQLKPRPRTVLYVAAVVFVSLTGERDTLLEWIEPFFGP